MVCWFLAEPGIWRSPALFFLWEEREERGDMNGKKSSSWHKDPVKAVEQLLVKAEEKLSSDEKFTVGDYIRLLQLREELGDEAPNKVEVLWVEPTEPSVSR
jgi:hypothetical protein